jgi:CRISPR system Cascade subunit CasE
MLLYRIHLDPRSKQARRDLASPYDMHATLCRAFAPPDQKCVDAFLWRLEPETDEHANPRVLVQSQHEADWSRVEFKNWLACDPDPGLDLKSRLRLDAIRKGANYRFRVRANPCVTRDGKRVGLRDLPEQENYLRKKGSVHGFEISSVAVSQEQLIRGGKHDGPSFSVVSALYDGVLAVTDPALFAKAIAEGIGREKHLGQGLLSVVPIR